MKERVAAADGYDKGKRDAGSGSGAKKGRKVKTEAGARRYGVAVGEYYTAEKGGQEPLERGMKGERTRSVQDRLIKLGLLAPTSGANGGRDGKLGPKTEAAIKEFQKRQGLPVTGKLDTRTGVLLDKTAPEGDPPNGKLPGGPAKVGPKISPKTQARIAALTPAEREAVIARAKAIAAAKGKAAAPAGKKPVHTQPDKKGRKPGDPMYGAD